MREPEEGGEWVLHVSRRERGLPDLVRALAGRGLAQAAAVPEGGGAAGALGALDRPIPLLPLARRAPIPGDGRPGAAGPRAWLRALGDALVLTRALRRRPDPAEAVVRWPEVGPVPVLHAHDPSALRAAWLALCLTGAPARLISGWSGEGPPGTPRPWRRCDLVLAPSPSAARALHAAGLEGRRIRVMEPAVNATAEAAAPDAAPPDAAALLAVYRELMRAPLARARRVDWSLR